MLFSFSRFLLFFFISFFFTCSDELTLYSSRRLKRSVAFRTFLRVFLRPLLGIKAEILVNLDKTVEAQTGSYLLGEKKIPQQTELFCTTTVRFLLFSFFFVDVNAAHVADTVGGISVPFKPISSISLDLTGVDCLDQIKVKQHLILY